MQASPRASGAVVSHGGSGFTGHAVRFNGRPAGRHTELDKGVKRHAMHVEAVLHCSTTSSMGPSTLTCVQRTLPCCPGVGQHLSQNGPVCGSTHGAPIQSTDGKRHSRDSTLATVPMQSTVPCYYGVYSY